MKTDNPFWTGFSFHHPKQPKRGSSSSSRDSEASDSSHTVAVRDKPSLDIELFVLPTWQQSNCELLDLILIDQPSDLACSLEPSYQHQS